jgi:hypothetical protein
MTVSLIQVPYVLGDERQGTSKGPGRLVEAGADKVVAAKGVAVRVERVDRGGPFRDSGNASLKACKQLADVVRKTVQAGAFPLILSGGCDVSKGILSGFDQSQCGIVWFDAHGDFNTPETTASGSTACRLPSSPGIATRATGRRLAIALLLRIQPHHRTRLSSRCAVEVPLRLRMRDQGRPGCSNRRRFAVCARCLCGHGVSDEPAWLRGTQTKSRELSYPS